MNSRRAIPQQFLALPRGVFDPKFRHRLIIIAKPLEPFHHLRRHLRATECREAFDLRRAQNRQHARAKWHFCIELLLHELAKLKVIRIIEKQLRQYKIRTVIDFVFQMPPIHLLARFARDVPLGKPGRPNRKPVRLPNELHQLIRIFQAALNLLEFPCPGGGIATQRQNIFNPQAPRFSQHIRQLLLCRIHARQMRHRRQPMLSLDAVHNHQRFLARAAARPVSHRAEMRLQRH